MYVQEIDRITQRQFTRIACYYLLATLVAFAVASNSIAQQSSTDTQNGVLSKQRWQQVDSSIQRGLDWLVSQQQRDGSFPTQPNGQPGVTSLCAMAFMANGHVPGEGPYGLKLEQAIDYIMSCQKRNGLLALAIPNSEKLPRNINHSLGVSAVYCHAISGLLLCEAYAMTGAKQAEKMRPIIRQALDATLQIQRWPKDRDIDLGGWRYLDDYNHIDSDLSVTGWQLMFLRSAKNAGFDVPEAPIANAIGYVKRCFQAKNKTFTYEIAHKDRMTRAMAGAGVLALAHAGLHNTPEAQLAGDWLLKNSFENYNSSSRSEGRYHYGLLMACQAMYQLGDDHWRKFFPATAHAIVLNQQPAGSWPAENHRNDAGFGKAYTSSLCLLALSAPNQFLPIFQR